MAATDIQYGGLDPVLYTPDFTFLRYVLDKKTSLYEKGLQSASASFNNIKKKVTDPVNAERRDQYLKEAEGQLQKIASSDLSLQQNVNFANSIFDPIATDKAFLFDSYHTQRIEKELAKEDAWMNSEDPNERKKYNAEIKEWVNRDLESLKNGKGDIANYKVQGRSAQAFVDAQDILAAEAKRQGFKMKVDEMGAPYIVTVEGGPGYAQNYETFANNVLANDQVYQKQTGILAQNRAEKILEQYKTDPKLAPMWANKKSDEIYADYAINSFDKHRKTQKEYIEALNKNLSSETADISAALNGPDSAKYTKGAADIAAGNNATPEASMYLKLKERADNRNNLSSKLKDIESDFNNTYGATTKATDDFRKNYVTKFVEDPTAIFADLQFKNDVTRFSNIKSSFYTRTIKEDRAYVDVTVAKTNALSTINKIQTTQHDDNLADAKFKELIRMDDAKLAMMGKKKVKKEDGSYEIVDAGTEADIKMVDVSGTQITSTKILNDLQSQVMVASSEALTNMTSNFGGLYMLQSMGLEQTKVGTLRGMFTRYFSADDKTTFKPTAEENKALSEAYTKMWAFAKDKNPNNTFLDQERANYGKSPLTIDRLADLLDKSLTGYKCKTPDEMKAKTAMVEYKNNLEKIKMTNNALEAGKKVVIEKIKDDKEFSPVIIQRNGNPDLVNENDIYNRIKNCNIKEVTSWYKFDKKINLSEEDLRAISKDYINGTLQVKFDAANRDNPMDDLENYSFTYKGKDYKMYNSRSTNPKYKKDWNTLFDGNFPDDYFLPQNFPASTERFQEVMQRVNERVPLPVFQKAAGTVSASPFFKLSGQTKQDVLDDLGKVTMTNSNIYTYDNGTATAGQVDPGLQDLIRGAGYDKDNIADVSLFTASPLNNGGQAVAIRYKTIKGTDKNPPPDWSGQEYYFPITVTDKSPKVFQIFSRVGEVSEYYPYKESGKQYTIDTFKAEGAYAEIYPKQPGSDEGTVKLWYKPYNPTTKTYSDQFVQYEKDMEFDLGKLTFSQIKESIYNDFIYPYVQGTLTYSKQVEANTIASGATPITSQSLYNQLIH